MGRDWFWRERDGAFWEYVVLLGLVAVIIAVLMPDLRKEAGCIRGRSMNHVNVGIGGQTEVPADCIAFDGDLIRNDQVPPPPSGGGGTPDPSTDATVVLPTEKDAKGCLVIRTVGQLQAMKTKLRSCYALGNNIDASGTRWWNDGAGFEPIGSEINNVRLSGDFEGNHYTITGLTINRPDLIDAALFGYIEGNIQNVTLESPVVIGQNRVASLVARTNGDYIRNVVVRNAKVEGVNGVSGFVNYLFGTSVEDVYLSGTIKGADEVSGVIGRIFNTNVRRVMADVSATSANTLSGLVDTTFTSESSSVPNRVEEVGCRCRLEGRLVYAVSSTTNHTTFKHIFLNGRATYTTSYYAFKNTMSRGGVSYIYTSMQVALDNRMVGDGPFFNRYATFPEGVLDHATTLYNYDLHPRDSDFGLRKTSAELRSPTPYAGWDFTNVWSQSPSINDGYPYLKRAPAIR